MTYEPLDAVDHVDGGSVLRLRVKPDADSSSVTGFDEWRGRFTVSLSEPAEDGRANKELTAFLGDHFDADVRLRSGGRSREKAVEVGLPPDDVLNQLPES